MEKDAISENYTIDRKVSHDNDYQIGYPSKDYPYLKRKIYNTDASYDKYNIDVSMFEFFVECNKDRLDEVMIEYLEEQITYRDMIKLVYQVARSLKQIGISKNDYIVSCMPNTPEVRALIYASSLIGATIHPVDPRTNPIAFKKITKDAKLILMSEEEYPKYKDIVSHVQVVTGSAIECFSKVRLLKEAYKLYRNHEKIPAKCKIEKSQMVTDWKSFISLGKKYKGKILAEYESNRVAIIESTSGTTEIPRGVMLSDKNVNYVAVEHIKLELDYQKGDTILDLLLPSIAYWLGTFHAMQCLGLKTYVMPALVIEQFPLVLAKLKPNNLILGPIHLEHLVKHDNLITRLSEILNEENIDEKLEKIILESDNLVSLEDQLKKISTEKENTRAKILKLIKEKELGDLSFIKHIISGGDVLGDKLLQETERVLRKHNCFIPITNGYGLTENCGVTGINPDQQRGKKEVVWFPLPDTDIAIFKKDLEEECQYNELGELCIKKNNNSSVMIGYKDDKEKTSQAIKVHNDGSTWLHTGDIAYIDKDGFVHNQGRFTDIIFKAGFKINPSAVEKVILTHPMVESCIVVGIEDKTFRTIPAAFIVLKDKSLNKEQIIEEIKKICEENLTYDYFTPDVFEIINSQDIPRNNSGKPVRKLLKEQLEMKRKK